MPTLQWVKCFVTMSTYWVPDLTNIEGSLVHLWRSIFIFANGASSACRWVLEKSEWPWEWSFLAIGMFLVELSAYQV